jgi:hypothetical protein
MMINVSRACNAPVVSDSHSGCSTHRKCLEIPVLIINKEVDDQMTDQAASVVERLCEAGSPRDHRGWEKEDGYYIATCRVSRSDVSSLIDIATKWRDPDWPQDDLQLGAHAGNVELLPVVAWRTLADLKSVESVQPLIDMLCELDIEFDDWATSELPHVFGKIGKPAVEPLVRLANDPDQPDLIRAVAAEGLQHVAEYHTETRDEVVAYLRDMMTKATRDSIEFNSIVLVGLVDLTAIEAADAIERAFSNDCLDVGMMGDWQEVRRQLGVQGLGLEMPRHPSNSVERFRQSSGIGIFSDEPIFDRDGEIDGDSEHAYYERAWKLFSASQEAQEVIDRCGRLSWFRGLMEFGLMYSGEIVDVMTVAGVEQYVFNYIPRKVSTEPETAGEIVLELTKFWEYLDRVFELPSAKSIIQWLQTDGLAARLEAEMSDPANFGMAKSMVMAGLEAGYDMSSEEGLAEFFAIYNEALASRAAPTPATNRKRVTSTTRHQKVGRNDPCPCGSGKKFKKCCR